MKLYEISTNHEYFLFEDQAKKQFRVYKLSKTDQSNQNKNMKDEGPKYMFVCEFKVNIRESSLFKFSGC